MTLSSLLSPDSYPTLFLACAVSGYLIPVPEDVVLLWAGLRVSEGVLGWWPSVLVALLGVGTRDLVAWSIGRFFGHLLATGWLGRLVSPKRVAKAQAYLLRRGGIGVFGGRFLVGFRVPVFVAAGAAGFPLRRFLLYDGLGLLIAVPGAIALGQAFGPSFVDVAHRVVAGSSLLWGGVIALVVVSGWLARRRHKVRARASLHQTEGRSTTARRLRRRWVVWGKGRWQQRDKGHHPH